MNTPTRANRPGDSQAMPVPNSSIDIQSQVIADIEARRLLGIERYGTALQANNGRDALQDLYEELVDACMYIKQALVERDSAREQKHDEDEHETKSDKGENLYDMP